MLTGSPYGAAVGRFLSAGSSVVWRNLEFRHYMQPEMVDTLTDVEQGGRQQLSLYQAPKVYFWLSYAEIAMLKERSFGSIQERPAI